jgi:hypothetical protein
MSKYTRGVQHAESRISQLEEEAVEEVRQRRFKKAMALKEQLGLTDDERHELAQLINGVDKDEGGSWKDLPPKQLHDLITMMEGFAFISYLISQRMDTVKE